MPIDYQSVDYEATDYESQFYVFPLLCRKFGCKKSPADFRRGAGGAGGRTPVRLSTSGNASSNRFAAGDEVVDPAEAAVKTAGGNGGLLCLELAL
jgi:hypothetical protein